MFQRLFIESGSKKAESYLRGTTLVLLCHKTCLVATAPRASKQFGDKGFGVSHPHSGDRGWIVPFRTHGRLRVGANLWVKQRCAGRQEVLGGKAERARRRERHRPRYIRRRDGETHASRVLHNDPARFRP